MTFVSGGNALLDIKFILNKAGVSAEMAVADLGCGSSGHFVFSTSEMVGKHGRVYAVDILKTVLADIERRAKLENIDNIIPVWSNLEVFKATKIESGSLDIALLINTLYQSHKRGEIMREAVRLIKKGGRLLVVDWKATSSPFGPPSNERVKPELVKASAKKLGLIEEQEFEAGQYHFGVLFSKI
jgi:ubiquinone/menaquinone biosynthesis C-methylase UbiE